MLIRLGIDELGDDAHAIPGAPDAPFQDRLAPSVAPISRRLFSRFLKVITDVREITLRERIFERFAITSSMIPSAKILVFRVRAEVEERKDRDGGRPPAIRSSLGRGAGAAGERLEGEGEIPGGLKPLLTFLLEAVQDDPVELGGKKRADGRGRRRRVVENGGHRVRGGFSPEGSLAGEHLVEDRPEGKDVRPWIGSKAPHLLRRHIAHRSQHGPRLGVALLRR